MTTREGEEARHSRPSLAHASWLDFTVVRANAIKLGAGETDHLERRREHSEVAAGDQDLSVLEQRRGVTVSRLAQAPRVPPRRTDRVVRFRAIDIQTEVRVKTSNNQNRAVGQERCGVILTTSAEVTSGRPRSSDRVVKLGVIER